MPKGPKRRKKSPGSADAQIKLGAPQGGNGKQTFDGREHKGRDVPPAPDNAYKGPGKIVKG